MAKKIARRQKNTEPEALPIDQRWTVVSVESNRPVYLPSKLGIDQAEAERLAAVLAQPARAVPLVEPSATEEPAEVQ